MSFDYDKTIKDIMADVDILNIDGKNQVKKILMYLQVCPFIDIVAEHLNINAKIIRNKLNYYLSNNEYLTLTHELSVRRDKILEKTKNEFAEMLDKVDEKHNFKGLNSEE